MLGYVRNIDQSSLADLAVQFHASDRLFLDIANSQDSIFRDRVTLVLLQNQDIFSNMYSNTGRPSVNPAIIMAAEIYKRQEGCSDRRLIELMHIESIVQYALNLRGLYADGVEPWCRDTLIEFRKRAELHKLLTGEDVYEKAYRVLVDSYKEEMQITMDNIRMDSTLSAANIKVRDRGGLLFEAIRIFARDLCRCYDDNEIRMMGLEPELMLKYWKTTTFRNQLAYYGTMTYAEACQLHMDVFAKVMKAKKITVHGQILSFDSLDVMEKVFRQHCIIEESEEGITSIHLATPDEHHMQASILQSVFDLDCTYRKKNHQEVRGYVTNTAEAVNINRSLIVDVRLHQNTVSDITMAKEFLRSLPDVDPSIPREKYGNLIVDGAYYSGEVAKLALTKGYRLSCTDLAGNKPDTWMAGFNFNGDTFIACPLGNDVLDCSGPNVRGEYLLHMDPEQCNNCPHREACRVKGQRVASVRLTLNQINRAQILGSLSEEEGIAIRNLRSGTEGVQSLIKNVYNRGRMLFKSLIRNQMDMFCVVSAINFRRLFNWDNGSSKTRENPLLT